MTAWLDAEAIARGLAKRHDLVCADGTVVCWECRRAEALLPSLHCGACLDVAWLRLGIDEPSCPQRPQTANDKEQMR